MEIENVKRLCIFNDIEDIELALKHDENAKQYFLQFSDDELHEAIEHYYNEEYTKLREETKQLNYGGQYKIEIIANNYHFVRNIDELEEVISNALNEWGIEIIRISAEKLD